MDFTFIDNAAIDKQTRKAIRSQVMKGRHVGRVHRPRGRRGREQMAQESQANPLELVQQHQRNTAMFLHQNAPLSLSPRIANSMLGVAHISEITPEVKRYAFTFIHKVMSGVNPPQICQVSETSDMIWFVYFFQDEAYFHSFAVLSHSAIDFTQKQSSNALRHLSKALQLTQENLSGSRALSDTTIACVVSLCYIYMVYEEPWLAMIHLNGLARMIQARGGIHRLHGALMSKAQHIDLELALQLGSTTCLDVMIKPLQAISPFFSDPSTTISSPLLDVVQYSGKDLYDATVDVLKISMLFRTRTATTKLSPADFQMILVTMRYRLQAIDTLGGSKLTDPVAVAVHLGLTAFMTMFGTDFGYRGRLGYERFFEAMRAALGHPALDPYIDLGTHLWLLLITGISIAGTDGVAWLSLRIKAVASRFGRRDWEFARQVVGLYPWVGPLHDLPASELWRSLFASTDDAVQLDGFV